MNSTQIARAIDKHRIGDAFGFRAFHGDGTPIPLFKENALGRAIRVRLDKMHSKEPYDHSKGPPWHLMLQKRRACGIWTTEMVWEPNLLVTSGILLAAQVLGAVGAEAAVQWLEIGTGTTAPVIGNTLLETVITTPAAMARNASTVTVQTSNTTRLDSTFGPNSGGSKAVTEAGDFNIATNNTIDMLARSTFGVKNIADNDSIQVIYDHLIS